MGDTTSDLSPELVTYFQRREQQRAEQVRATLAAMTPIEQRLVREVAVMAYVRGRQHGRDGEQPSDAWVLEHVIACCHGMPDLYPIINGLAEARTDG
jgi:hypothetical protein